MTIFRDFSAMAVSLGACLLASHVHAAAITDINIQGSGGFDGPAAVFSGSGKPRKDTINALAGLFEGDAWSLLDKTNKPSAPYNDVVFQLNADTRRRSGIWELNWDTPEFSPNMDFILLLKAGKQWGAYLIPAAGLGPMAQTLAGNFEISWVNKKGRTPKLRYASMYGRDASDPALVTDSSAVAIDASAVQIDSAAVPSDAPALQTQPVASNSSPTGPDASPFPASIVESTADTSAVVDPNDIPAPGSLALVALAFVLAAYHWRQGKYDIAKILVS